MKRIKGLYWFVPLCLLVACGRVEQPVTGNETGEHTCELRLVGGITAFDGATKADGTFVFSETNRIYVRMVAGDRVLLGEAAYKEDGSWSFTYNGSLGGATEGTAYVVLFERRFSKNSIKVTCDYRTPIYEDLESTFTVADGMITLKANLTPKTGRMSFVNDLDEDNSRVVSERMSGISYYSGLNLSDFTFTVEERIDDYYTQGKGTDTEYLYGFFTDSEDPAVWIYRWGEYYYRHFLNTVFLPGQSGYVKHPDEDSSGWKHHPGQINIWLSGINGSAGTYFNMRYVPAGTFLMGNESSEASSPVHAVTLSHYYICEQEQTRDMWYNVMGAPSDWANNISPAYYLSYEEIQEYIEKLNNKTGYRFRLPTEAEWEFAARGGNYSNGYVYSGSNILEDVVRRRNDYAVKTLSANELGLYDMSGNIAELCQDWYAPYSEGALTNPTGPASGDFHVVRGGYTWDAEDRFPVWARARTVDYGEGSNDAIGFRLVLDVPVVDY